MSKPRVSQVGDIKNVLGEGPLWDAQEQALYWTDVEGKRLWRHDPEADTFTSWKTPGRVGSFAVRASGGAVLAMEDGFHAFDFDSGACARIGNVVEDDAKTRFNDGKVDRQGRFLAGTMDDKIQKPYGSLYCLDPDGTVRKLDSTITCSNGPCFSPDGTTLYFTDTTRYAIWSYNYDPDTGAVSDRQVFADLSELGLVGAPDGCTVDSEGFLWGALCLGGRIVRYTPDGAVDRVIEMPVQYVSSVMFGGPNLDVLYVTSIAAPLLGKPPTEPNAGGLFRVEGLGVKGIAEPRFAG